ncbi:hypothetical protein HMPREF0972_01851 [Actinomyces sp. oral taxon 848 str. F0332]|nr:hypothetical protein HMPREF0972_01851 [Actinomyces sp. oral taxon 848 str. F0332]
MVYMVYFEGVSLGIPGKTKYTFAIFWCTSCVLGVLLLYIEA